MAKSVYIADVCKEIFAGGDVPKDALSYEKTAEYNVPIFSNGEKNCGLYGYTNNARVKEPSITVSARGTIGYTAIRTEPFVPVVRLITMTPKSEVIDLDYLFYATQNYKFEGSGTSIPQLTVPILKKYKFPLPEMSHQKAIAVKFEKLDQLISLRKQQLKKLDDLVKARFVEMFGNPKDNKKEWNRVPLKKVAEVRGRVGWKGYKKEDLQESGPLVLGATHLTENGNIDLSSPVYLSRDKYEESPEIMLHRNDLVFTQRGNTIGKVGLVKEDIGEATINPCVLILRPTNIHPIYLDVYLIMDEVKKDMWRLNAGSAQPMITQKGISEYLLMLPPIELQNQFAAFVERVDQQKQTVQQGLEKLELMKKALMQEYFG